MASPGKQRLAFKYSKNVEKAKLQRINEEPVKAAAEHDLDSKLLQTNAPAELKGRAPHVISASVVIDKLHEAVQEDADTTTADYEHVVELHATPGVNGSVKDVVVAGGRPRSSIQLPRLSTTSSQEPEQQQIKDDDVVVVDIDSVKRKIVIEAGKLMVRVLELVQDLQTEGPSTRSRMLENSKAAAAAHVVDVVVAADEEKEEDREQLQRHEGAPISSCNAVMKSMHERANRDDDVAAAAVAVENLKSSLAQAMKFCDSEFSQLQTYSCNRTSPKRPLAEVSASGRLIHALSSLHRELQEINVRTAAFLEPSSSDIPATTTPPELDPLSAIFNTAGSGLNPATPGAVKLDPLSAIGNSGPGLPATLAAAAHLDPLPAICNTGSGLNPATLHGAAQLDPLLAISNTAESGLFPAIITLPGATQLIDNPDSAICNTGAVMVQQQPCKRPVHIATVPLRFKCSATRPPRAQGSSTFQIQKTSLKVAATGNTSCTAANDGLLSEQLQIDVPILLSSSDDEEEEETALVVASLPMKQATGRRRGMSSRGMANNLAKINGVQRAISESLSPMRMRTGGAVPARQRVEKRLQVVEKAPTNNLPQQQHENMLRIGSGSDRLHDLLVSPNIQPATIQWRSSPVARKKRSRTPSSDYCINRLTPDPTSEESSEESDNSENSTDMDSEYKSFSQGMSGRFKPQHAGARASKRQQSRHALEATEADHPHTLTSLHTARESQVEVGIFDSEKESILPLSFDATANPQTATPSRTHANQHDVLHAAKTSTRMARHACRKSCVDTSYYSSAVPISESARHQPALYPYVREPTIPPLQRPASGARRRSKNPSPHFQD
ncbi:unnamed protein product [Sphagnum troendelagicum]|uniref:Uncharacterized protein n=1 Tax=Sphagnum troendelagicum TaxID=128251 RepID=A0ABP0TK95_9BRYO